MNDLTKYSVNTDAFPVEWLVTKEEEPLLRRIVERKSNYKTALYANIPLVCKGDKCPYNVVCYEYTSGVIKNGSRCLPEIALIISYASEYINMLGIDERNVIDMMLVKDLVTCDIIIDRAQKLLAIEDMIVDKIVGFDENGVPTSAQNVHSAHKILDKQLARKHKILQLLNATPKDRHMSDSAKRNLSEVLINLREQLQARSVDINSI